MKRAYPKLSKKPVEQKKDPSYPKTQQQKLDRVIEFLEAITQSLADDTANKTTTSLQGRLATKKRPKEERLDQMKPIQFELLAWDVLVGAIYTKVSILALSLTEIIIDRRKRKPAWESQCLLLVKLHRNRLGRVRNL